MTVVYVLNVDAMHKESKRRKPKRVFNVHNSQTLHNDCERSHHKAHIRELVHDAPIPEFFFAKSAGESYIL